MKERVIIRKATKNDCKVIPKIESIVRNETYKGIVNDKFLEELYLTENDRINKILDEFDENTNHKYVLEINNQVVGFMDVGISNNYSNCGEILTLYIMKKYTNKGFGRKLLNEGIKEIKKMGFNKMIVGCFEKNPANEFYKHLGGKPLEVKKFELFNINEIFYIFENL